MAQTAEERARERAEAGADSRVRAPRAPDIPSGPIVGVPGGGGAAERIDALESGAPSRDEEDNFGVPIGFTNETAANLLTGDTSIPPGIYYYDERGRERLFQDYYYQDDMDEIFAGLGDQAAYDVQRALVAAGFLSSSAIITYGQWRDDAKAAFKQLLAVSNRSGTPWDQVLNKILRDPNYQPPGGGGPGPGGGGGGGGGRAFQPKIPDRDELKRGFKTLYLQSIGGNFARPEGAPSLDDDAEAFATSFTNQYVGAQRQAFDGQPINEPPSVEAEATEQLEADRQTELDANAVTGFVRILEGLVG